MMLETPTEARLIETPTGNDALLNRKSHTYYVIQITMRIELCCHLGRDDRVALLLAQAARDEAKMVMYDAVEKVLARTGEHAGRSLLAWFGLIGPTQRW